MECHMILEYSYEHVSKDTCQVALLLADSILLIRKPLKGLVSTQTSLLFCCFCTAQISKPLSLQLRCSQNTRELSMGKLHETHSLLKLKNILRKD